MGVVHLHSFLVSGYTRFDVVRSREAQTVHLCRSCRSCRSRRMCISSRSCGWKLLIAHRVTHISRASRASRQCDCLSHSLCSERTSHRWSMSSSQTVVRVNAVRVIRETHTVVVQIEWFSCLSQFSSSESRNLTCSCSALSSCPSRSLLSFA